MHEVEVRSKLIKVTGNYRWLEGAHFDVDYYRNHHARLAWRLLHPLGLVRFECDKSLITGEPKGGAIVASSNAYFSSLETANAALAAAGAQLAADVPRYTNIRPELHFSEAWVSTEGAAELDAAPEPAGTRAVGGDGTTVGVGRFAG
jgi:uncharacterized protein (TIGR02118 family)